MIEIREVLTRKQRKQFIKFQNELYKDVPQYIPTLMVDEMEQLDERKNPAFKTCRMRMFLAYKDEKIVGRIGGIIKQLAYEKYGWKRIAISRFDFIDDEEVVDALIGTLTTWAKEEKLEELYGPVGFHDMDKEGMLVDGFEEMGMFITYYNFPYYQKHMERLGFIKEKDWVESRLYTDFEDEVRVKQLVMAMNKNSNTTTYRLKNRFQIWKKVPVIFSLLDSEYAELYGTTEITEDLAKYFAKQFILIVKKEYLYFIKNAEGEDIGLGLAVPSLTAVKKMKGRIFPFGFITLYKAIHKPKVLDLYFIALKKEYRKTGVPLQLLWELTNEAKKNGVLYAETGPNLEENMNIRKLWRLHKKDSNIRRRRCYIKRV